jgi:hypothetical protein
MMKKLIEISQTRRKAVAAALCLPAGLSSSRAGAASPIASRTLDERIASAKAVVIAEIHGFLFSEPPLLDDFRAAAEIANPQRVMLDISVVKILAIKEGSPNDRPKLGRALIDILWNAEDRGKDVLYSPSFGHQGILLLGDRRDSRPTLKLQPPIYIQQVGSRIADRSPLPLDRLPEVMSAIEKSDLKKIN